LLQFNTKLYYNGVPVDTGGEPFRSSGVGLDDNEVLVFDLKILDLKILLLLWEGLSEAGGVDVGRV